MSPGQRQEYAPLALRDQEGAGIYSDGGWGLAATVWQQQTPRSA